MRWRLSGTGWELAAGLQVLARQVDEVWPTRHAADGTLGNVTHSSRTSDHNPDSGIVRALDIGEVVENDAMIVAEAIRKSKDRRIKYVIHESEMYSYYQKNGVPPFTWRPYSGINLHWNHVHISSRSSYDSDTQPWNIGGGEKDMPLNELDKATVDIAYALGAQYDRSYWYGLDRDDPEFASLGTAVREKANNLLDRLGALEAGSADTVARAAHVRLDKLHQI